MDGQMDGCSTLQTQSEFDRNGLVQSQDHSCIIIIYKWIQNAKKEKQWYDNNDKYASRLTEYTEELKFLILCLTRTHFPQWFCLDNYKKKSQNNSDCLLNAFQIAHLEGRVMCSNRGKVENSFSLNETYQWNLIMIHSSLILTRRSILHLLQPTSTGLFFIYFQYLLIVKIIMLPVFGLRNYCICLLLLALLSCWLQFYRYLYIK